MPVLFKQVTNSEGEREREYNNQQTETFGSDFIQSVWKGWLIVKSGKIMGIRGLEVKTVKVT